MCYRPNYIVAKTNIASFLENIRIRYIYYMMNKHQFVFANRSSLLFIHCIVFVFILSSQKKFREVDERPKAYLVAEFGIVV